MRIRCPGILPIYRRCIADARSMCPWEPSLPIVARALLNGGPYIGGRRGHLSCPFWASADPLYEPSESTKGAAFFTP
eukprot:6928701-Pyramimonas_sp.AAC.1